MIAERLRLSHQMSVITAQPALFAPYQQWVPHASLIPYADNTSVGDDGFVLPADTSIVLIINRPPLDLDQTVACLRANPGGKDLYLVVITPEDIPYQHQSRLDADDYLFLKENADVQALVNICLNRYARDAQLRDQFLDATKNALNAMDSASHYGSLVHFFELSEQCNSIASLAESVYQFLLGKQLSINFIIDTGSQKIYWPREDVSSAKLNMLERMACSRKRMVSVDKLLGVSAQHFTLLISNAPAHNPERHGQLKDAMAHFCAIVESRIKDIMIRESIARQHHEIVEIMSLIRQSTQESKAHIKRIMTTLCQEVELAATTFDMNLREEEKLLSIASEASDNLFNLQENDQLLESHCLSLIDTISSIQLLTNGDKADTDSGDNVELF